MRIYTKYIATLVLTSSLINISLAFFGQDKLEVYFTINIIAYLVITLLYTHFNPKAKRALNTVAYILFTGFMVIIAFKAIEIMVR